MRRSSSGMGAASCQWGAMPEPAAVPVLHLGSREVWGGEKWQQCGHSP